MAQKKRLPEVQAVSFNKNLVLWLLNQSLAGFVVNLNQVESPRQSNTQFATGSSLLKDFGSGQTVNGNVVVLQSYYLQALCLGNNGGSGRLRTNSRNRGGGAYQTNIVGIPNGGHFVLRAVAIDAEANEYSTLQFQGVGNVYFGVFPAGACSFFAVDASQQGSC